MSLSLSGKQEKSHAALINWHLHSYERKQLVRRQIDQLHTRVAKTAVVCNSAVGKSVLVTGKLLCTMSLPRAPT
jgi:hypothetical protein